MCRLERNVVLVVAAGLRRCGVGIDMTAAVVAAGRHELDLVRHDLKLAAGLTVALPTAVAELALDGDLRALVQEAGQGLGAAAEHGDVYEVGRILPLAGLAVLASIVDGDAEGEHVRTGGGGAELWITGEVARDVDAVDAHVCLFPSL